MNNKRTFSVAAIGFTEHEERVIKSIMRLSISRSRSYTLIDISMQEPAEILLVNWENPDALVTWNAYRAERSEVPAILVAKVPPNGSQDYHTSRPIVASRLIKTLDQVTIQELKFVPELVINKENSEQTSQKQESNPSNKLNEALIQKQEASAKRYSYRALVVDDSRTIRKVIDLQLRMLDIRADLAESARGALAFLRDNTYDIIFLDVVLPDSPGFQVCKAIKKDPVKKKTPVIMLTGNSSPLDRIKGKFSGCDTYLTKPVDPHTFLKAVRKYLPVKPSKPASQEGKVSRPLNTPLYQ